MLMRWLSIAAGIFPARQRRQRRARQRRQFFRPRLESLEGRRLLAIVGNSTEWMLDETYEPTSLIVQFREGESQTSSLAAYLAGASLGEEWAIVPGMREVHLNPGFGVEEALEAYENDPNVLYAEPDYRVQLNFIPNDPFFASEQWPLDNVGQAGGFAGSDISAIEAWDVETGDPSVVVAVIDTGVDYTHPDLAPNMWENPGEIPNNKKDDDSNGYVDDVYGYNFADNNGDPMDDYFHGTHVAGTIAAVMDNGIGIAGVAPNVKIMALKFLDQDGGGITSDAIRALNYAVAEGVTISNNSWGGGSFSSSFQTALNNAASQGHIFVAAAGNNGDNNDTRPFYPANYTSSSVVSVAATDPGDYPASFSNYGKKTVDIAAPGVGIYSTLPMNRTAGMIDYGLNAEYGLLSGTSMATPHVTGVIALVMSQHPEWTSAEVIQQVLSTGDPVDDLGLITVTGGRLNAAAALGVVPVDSTPPRVISADPTGAIAGPVNHARIRFSERMNPETFDLDDIVSFEGPNGTIVASGISPVPGQATKYDIVFEPQTTPGAYSLVLGPHISDMVGLEIDQDGDTVGGIDGADDFSTGFTIVNTEVFSSLDVPKAISGLSVFTSTLEVEQNLSIEDVNVSLNLTYPRVGNLNVWLTSPAGTTVYLSRRHGGANPNFTDTVFDDEAPQSITSGQTPFTGSFQPDDSLAALDGETAFGTWQLSVQNMTTRSRLGTLNSWSLNITTNDSSTAGDGDGNGDGDSGDADGNGQNDRPQPADDFVSGLQGSPVAITAARLLGNDYEPDGDELSIVSVDNPSGGNVYLNPDGSITFEPEVGGLASGSFSYTVYDGVWISSAIVYVEVLSTFELHNYDNPADVDNDTVISANDVISIINFINAHGSTPVEKIRAGGVVTMYFDVVADNYIAADDCVAVINFINSQSKAKSVVEAEGEAGSSLSVATNGAAMSDAAVDACLLDFVMNSSTDGKRNR
jgi:serine protease